MSQRKISNTPEETIQYQRRLIQSIQTNHSTIYDISIKTKTPKEMHIGNQTKVDWKVQFSIDAKKGYFDLLINDQNVAFDRRLINVDFYYIKKFSQLITW